LASGAADAAGVFCSSSSSSSSRGCIT
jgi:hypothetical protein